MDAVHTSSKPISMCWSASLAVTVAALLCGYHSSPREAPSSGTQSIEACKTTQQLPRNPLPLWEHSSEGDWHCHSWRCCPLQPL